MEEKDPKTNASENIPLDQSAPTEGESLETAPDKTSKSEVSEQTPAFTSNKISLKTRLIKRMSSVNIYLVVFLVILLVAIGLAAFSLSNARKSSTEDSLVNKTLTPEELAKLKSTDAKIGEPKQTLTIESNSIFNGKVLVKDNLDVAGAITVGGSLTLPGLNVSGVSSFDTIQVGRTLDVAGSVTVQSQLNIQGNLTVGSGASFGGNISAPSITVNSLQLNGDLVLTRHIDAGGSLPGVSSGNGIGSGGTVSVSGNDTAGTININTGNGTAAGTLANINFALDFQSTPHVLITPIGVAAAQTQYYVTRTTGGFTVHTNTAPPAASTLVFDYFVID